MKKRVLSVRVPYRTIAQCYRICRSVNIDTSIGMSSVITTALNILVASAEKGNLIPGITEDEAVDVVERYVGNKSSWPGKDVEKISELVVNNIEEGITEKVNNESKPNKPVISKEEIEARKDALKKIISDRIALLEQQESEEIINSIINNK